MKRIVKSMVIGALALVGATIASTDGQAMPVQTLGSTAAPASGIEHVWWRRPFYGYGFRRFGYGFRPYGYGFRPYGYGYGWRRPFYGYGYRRW